MIKKIDDLGRFAIPREIRRSMRLMGGDQVEIIQRDNTIVIQKYLPQFSSQLEEIKNALVEWAQENNTELSNTLLNSFQSLIEEVQKVEIIE